MQIKSKIIYWFNEKSEMETQKTATKRQKTTKSPTEGKCICMLKRKKYETSD